VRLGRLLRRLALSLLVVALVLVVAAGSLLSWLVVRGFPQREGVATLAGLSAPVRVVRDANGIAHIYAATTEDLFAAQGYVHASERMWQMEVWRRTGSGRLAELFGESQWPTDHFIRVLGWRQSAEADLAVLSAEGRLALDAYAHGVNAWLDTHPELPLPFVVAGFLGPGGGLAGFRPEPWTALDTLTWQKVQAWSLGSDLDRELFRVLAARRGISDEALARLLPAYDMTRPVVVPSADRGPVMGLARTTASTPASATAAPDAGRMPAATAAGLLAADARLRAAIGVPGGLFASAGLLGSNAWAVAPERTATGHALLANDPHLGISMPSVWYLVGLHCQPVGPACPYELAGAGFPGVPGIVLGHNARIAWGLTNVGPDVMDVFEERLDPADEWRYFYGGESLAFELRRETVSIAGADPIEFDVRSTVHGPLISDVQFELRPESDNGAELGRAGYAYAMAWAATAEPDRTLDSVLAVNRAADWDEFRSALSDFGGPSQTFVYADVDGHIGVQIPGRIPVRAAGDGSRPAPGEDGSHDWTGWVPFDEMPYLYDPPSGLVVAANNMPSDTGPFLGSDFDPGYRAARARELLDAAPTVTTDMARTLQGDVVLTRAAPVIAAAADAQPATDDGRRVLDAIRAWAGDLSCTTASAGCAAFETFEYRLLRGLVDDELGYEFGPENAAWRWVGSEVSHEALVRLVAAPNDAWWDDTTTADIVETRDAILTRALDQAGDDLRRSLGDPAGWTWGRIHTVTFREQSLGSSGVGPIEALFNKGPYPAPGSCTTINKICGWIANTYPPPGDYADLPFVFPAGSSPSYRLVVDMGDLDGASIIHTTGQSGLPFDAHYGDYIDKWLANVGLPLPWSPSAVDAARRQELTLRP
jgi:penicillin amidase